MHDPAVLIYTDGSKSREGVEYATAFDVFISLPLVASTFPADLYAIFLALSRISFYDSTNFVIYSDS